MSSYEKWGVVLAAVGVTLNLFLFIAFAYQLRLIRKQVEQTSEITRLDHDRRKKQATLEWASSAFERQWVFNKGMPPFHDFAAFREYASQPDSTDHEPNLVISEWLDLMEDFATGVNLDVYDVEVVKRLMGARIMRGWRNLSPWIAARRASRQQPTLFIEFEMMARRLYSDGGNELPEDLVRAPEFD